MTEWKAKRFWETVAFESAGDGYQVSLDGRPLRTPSKKPLLLPTPGLASEVKAEWEAQSDTIDPASMPFTRTANTAIDKVAPQQGEIVRLVAAYGDSDLLCYRAAQPESLVARQLEQWDPVLDWANENFGLHLATRTGVMHAPQSESDLNRLHEEVAKQSSFQLAAFHDLVSLSGSLVLGLAVMHRHLDPLSAWDSSVLDETWQQEKWGQDAEALAAANHKKAGFVHAARFLDLCQIIS